MKNNNTRKYNEPFIENRKARYNYFIEETLVCGIELRGNEVKSIREGSASIADSWIVIENNELILKKMNITPWRTANSFDVDATRERRLLATKKQIRELDRKIQQAGYTLVPLKVFFKDGRVKVDIGLAKGKHNYDKRQVERDKQVKLDISRAMKN